MYIVNNHHAEKTWLYYKILDNAFIPFDDLSYINPSTKKKKLATMALQSPYKFYYNTINLDLLDYASNLDMRSATKIGIEFQRNRPSRKYFKDNVIVYYNYL